MSLIKSQKLKEAIKSLLKLKKKNYKDLAEYLECSEPTVKRILGGEELTLSRLISICEFLDLELGELESYANKILSSNKVMFTKEQEDFLGNNPCHFAYLMKIYCEKTPEDIAKEFNLTKKSTDRYLMDLEKHDLIKVTGKLKVKPAYKDVPTLGNGKLAKLHIDSIFNSASKFLIKRLGDIVHSPKETRDKYPGYSGIRVTKISRSTYTAWHEEFVKKLEELSHVANLESKTLDDKDLMMCVTLTASALTDIDDKNVHAIEESFGDIKNL